MMKPVLHKKTKIGAIHGASRCIHGWVVIDEPLAEFAGDIEVLIVWSGDAHQRLF